ncbi:EAL domain-containing protein [Undibacterium sp. SXout7W]|uniref:EAL domain-containing protein n=1 Tax=Undibacterium sp. SXout7W TaxID=3413049 RepID=UPI003BF2BEC2
METAGISGDQEVPFGAVVLCICLILVAIIAQSYWSVTEDKTITVATAQEHNYLAARTLEEHASRVMHGAARVVSVVSEEIHTAITDPAKQKNAILPILSNQRQDVPFLYAVSLINADGVRWLSTQPLLVSDQNLLGQKHIKSLLDDPHNTQIIIGDAVLVPFSDQWILPMARNIYDHQGRQFGIIQIDIKLRYFQEFYERIAQGNSAVISLHDTKGHIFARAPFDPRYFSQKLEASALTNALDSELAEGSVEDKPLVGAGGNLLYTYRKIPEFPLTLVYAREMDNILVDWRARLKQRILFAAGTTMFILTLAMLMLWQLRYLQASKARLEASESRYRLLYTGAQDAILLINRDYIYVDCNPAALKLFGVKSTADVIGKRVGSFSNENQHVANSPGLDKDSLVVKLVDQAFHGEPQRFEWVTQREGQQQHIEVSLSRVEVDGELLLFCVERDINTRKYTEHLLQGQNRLLQLIGGGDELPYILDAVCEFVEKLCPHWCTGIQLLSDDQRTLSLAMGSRFPSVLKHQLPGLPVAHGSGVWNEAILQASPVWAADLQQDLTMQFVNGLEQLAEFSAGGAWPVVGKNGQLLGSFTLFLSGLQVLTDRDLSLIGITTDIAGIAIEGRRSERKILRLAHYDELTGLPNRFLYNQHLSKSLAIAERNRSELAVIFLDLDRFKNINDTFGHDEGDKVLCHVAQRFRRCLRESDVIARVGGDEFILLIDQYAEPRDLGDIADKLLYEASQPFEIDGQECQLSASVGIATYPADGKDAQTLLKNADIAMYRAKNKGKDNYQFYASEMNIHTVERLAFEARLRKALERREFVVYYQPKVDLQSGRIVGAEALVRWNHPEKGILYPGDFITLAEEAGLIARLGMLVLDIACRDILSFRAADKHFGRVAINLSGSQFNDVNMLEEVKSVIDFWRVPSQSIEFEITESMVMHNREQAIALMDGLKQAGFTLSIDDFGTGYSSLAYLKRFPVDSVKVDRSFIRDIPDDPNDTAIVLAIVAMAHTLGLKVIAEGVDSPTQLATLLECKCDEYQGFYFSKAIPDKEFLQLLQKQAASATT